MQPTSKTELWRNPQETESESPEKNGSYNKDKRVNIFKKLYLVVEASAKFSVKYIFCVFFPDAGK